MSAIPEIREIDSVRPGPKCQFRLSFVLLMRHLASESTWQLELQILQIRLEIQGQAIRMHQVSSLDVDVDVALVAMRMHTPLLPEMATGMIATRHIATPVRAFCKRARYYHASVTGWIWRHHALA